MTATPEKLSETTDAPAVTYAADVIEMIAISEIDDSDRMRPIDPVFADAIAASMKRDGQLQPIDICRLVKQASGKPYRLVFGSHRIAGARLNGWTHIAAVQRSANALDRKSREIAENFFKASLAPLDAARFVAELIKTEKARLNIDPAKDGRSMNGAPKTAKAKKQEIDDDLCIVHKSYGLQESVANRLGLTQATVSRHLALDALPPTLIARVRKLPIAANATALRKLAGMEPKAQNAAVGLMETGKAKDINSALAIIAKKPPVSAEDKRLKTFVDTFMRMGKKEQEAALMLLRMPKGWTLDFGPAKPARPNDVVDVEDYIKDAAE